MGMDNYEWQKNKAIVDRMYYSERVVETTTFFAAAFTAVNMLYIRNNYFAARSRSYILPTWKWWAIINVATVAVLQYPLTADERRRQLRKRLNMGKWLYTLWHLDDPEEEAK